jgi:uroporphyrinogen-III synthase
MLGADAVWLERPVAACIGPITAEAARAAGLDPRVVATTYTIPGLVDALRSYYLSSGRRPVAARGDQ